MSLFREPHVVYGTQTDSEEFNPPKVSGSEKFELSSS